jgi:hypothetical protein
MMARIKRRIEERFTLVATIQSIERAYSILEMNEAKRLDDEGTLTIFGEIQKISRRYQRMRESRSRSHSCALDHSAASMRRQRQRNHF